MAKVKCPKCFFVNPDGQESCVRCNAPLPRIRIDAQPSPRPAAGPNPQQGQGQALQFHPGQVIAGRYSVQSLIGRGGMGCIYKVNDNVLGETVALKTLLPQFVRDQLVVDRFFNEARIARKLAHPNVVRVHDIGSADGTVYISMEYLQGISLRGMLEGQPAGGRIPLPKVLHIIDDLCAALEYAHQYTIHRDIKPENIMIMADGTVKLMDFGISKLMANTRMTAASVVMGTPFYMSPEQLRNSRDVDARADIYSVGVLMYEIITGNIPTGVPKPASAVATEVPPALDAIISKCVATDPRDRFATASELREALLPIISLVKSGSSITGPDKKAPVSMPSVPLRKVAGWLLLLLVLVGSFAAIAAIEQQRREQTAAAGAFDEDFALEDVGGDLDVAKVHNLIERLRGVSSKVSGLSPTLAEVYRQAEDKWGAAQRAVETGDPNAAQLLRHALQYYVAPLLGSDVRGMVFIPEGNVTVGGRTVYLEPFFIDELEVTRREFLRFTTSVPGGWPHGLQGLADEELDIPYAGARFFDAQAFAASRGKLLPTTAQWSRAAYGIENSSDQYPWGKEFTPEAAQVGMAGMLSQPEPGGSYPQDRTRSGCIDMVGSLSEWTRTPVSGQPTQEAPTFGTRMVIRGGNFGSEPMPLSQSGEADFYDSEATIGFRCVAEIPTDLHLIEQMLARYS